VRRTTLALSPFHELRLRERIRVIRHSPTEGEAALWRSLKARQLGVSFKAQAPILGYIVEFYGSAANLVVEVDGGVMPGG
jgi:very-short-patch-repair endonuclease